MMVYYEYRFYFDILSKYVLYHSEGIQVNYEFNNLSNSINCKEMQNLKKINSEIPEQGELFNNYINYLRPNNDDNIKNKIPIILKNETIVIKKRNEYNIQNILSYYKSNLLCNKNNKFNKFKEILKSKYLDVKSLIDLKNEM
jgi:hypothetical protein